MWILCRLSIALRCYGRPSEKLLLSILFYDWSTWNKFHFLSPPIIFHFISVNIAGSSFSPPPNTTRPRYSPTPNIDGAFSFCHTVLPLLLFDVPFDCGVCFDAKVRIDELIVLEFIGDRSRRIMFVISEEPKKTKPTFHHNVAAQWFDIALAVLSAKLHCALWWLFYLVVVVAHFELLTSTLADFYIQ